MWPGVSVVAAVPQQNPGRQWDRENQDHGRMNWDSWNQQSLGEPESMGMKLNHVKRPQSQLTAGRFARGKVLEEGDATPDEQSLQTQEF